jgi:2-(1,2-epoxy-1,2-dihydrophenyl)acetyl-CoA isomerase
MFDGFHGASPSPRWYHRDTVTSGGSRMGQDLLEVVEDGVAVLTLNRPDRLNAMSEPMLAAMLEALPRLADDPEVGVIVLTGAGRGFCAGGDVKAMAEGREFSGTSLEEKAQTLRSSMEVSRWLHEMPKVTIAMVRGAAAGAGLSLALACDLRVASDTARFATAFARVGYSGDFGGSWYLTQLVGTAKARELYYTADIVDAQQALTLGIVNRVIPDTRLEEETMTLAGRLARGPRVAYRYMKRNFNAAESGTLKDSLDLEAWHHTRCGMTEDHREAAKAFVEKREPTFKGR